MDYEGQLLRLQALIEAQVAGLMVPEQVPSASVLPAPTGHQRVIRRRKEQGDVVVGPDATSTGDGEGEPAADAAGFGLRTEDDDSSYEEADAWGDPAAQVDSDMAPSGGAEAGDAEGVEADSTNGSASEEAAGPDADEDAGTDESGRPADSQA
jgi:hypothetical protein